MIPPNLSLVPAPHLQLSPRRASSMQFQCHNKTYQIEFQRRLQPVTVFLKSKNCENRLKVSVVSTFPYTTVTIYEVIQHQPHAITSLYRTATVGRWRNEKLRVGESEKERGRIHALRALGKGLSREMRHLMWDAYMHRNHAVHVQGDIVEGEVVSTRVVGETAEEVLL